MKDAFYPLIVGATAFILARCHTAYMVFRPYWTDAPWDLGAQIAQWMFCIAVSGVACFLMVRWVRA